MRSMLAARGLDPGPQQRPLTTGTLAGLAASLPALAVLDSYHWIATLAEATGAMRPSVGVACALLLAAGGWLYGAVFRRAANDPLGGWLFGMAFAFVLWMLVPLPLLQWLPERPVLVGPPAMGLLLGALLWGAGLGAAFPLIHRHLRAGIAAPTPAKLTGPEAAAPSDLRERSPAEAGKKVA